MGAAFLVPYGIWWRFLQPFVMGTSSGLLKQNMCQNDLLNLVKLRSSSHVSTTQIG